MHIGFSPVFGAIKRAIEAAAATDKGDGGQAIQVAPAASTLLHRDTERTDACGHDKP